MGELLVIPCYEEEARLDLGSLDTLLARPSLSLVLVDDGSRDGTRRLLEGYRDRHPGRRRRTRRKACTQPCWRSALWHRMPSCSSRPIRASK